MFWNIYQKRVLAAARDFETLLWTWIFPLGLATLFYFAFSSLDTADQLDAIPTALVADGALEEEAIFSQVVDMLASEEEEGLFLLQRVDSVEKAQALLKENKIDGYYLIENGEPKLRVARNGLNQTIQKSFLDQYLQQKAFIIEVIEQHPEQISPMISQMMEQEELSVEISLSKAKPTSVLGFYYALLAMVCMYGGFQGIRTVTGLQANLSALGARRTIAPASRLLVMTADLCGGLTVQFSCLCIVVAYILGILRVDFGPRIALILFTCLVSCLAGVAFGAMISVSKRLSADGKIGVVVGVTMACCCLAGLVVGDINYIIAEKFPPLAWINPAARISDAFYCLYYYDNYTRYTENILILLAMSLGCILITAFFIRRQQYESI